MTGTEGWFSSASYWAWRQPWARSEVWGSKRVRLSSVKAARFCLRGGEVDAGQGQSAALQVGGLSDQL
ncbi:MAG: hypothetical protein ACYDHB_13065, partial [Candidatus Dormibacteria bacterium]